MGKDIVISSVFASFVTLISSCVQNVAQLLMDLSSCINLGVMAWKTKFLLMNVSLDVKYAVY